MAPLLLPDNKAWWLQVTAPPLDNNKIEALIERQEFSYLIQLLVE